MLRHSDDRMTKTPVFERLNVFNDFTVNFDHDKGTLLTLLDLSPTFDIINHDKLLLHLSNHLGFGDSGLNLIKSY